ncbi:MAG TPA: hypothetical protein VMB34_05435 [Acetobacteraceae bacterium]|nr:hypothetical protein [Acetobacteraceae bacterium]
MQSPVSNVEAFGRLVKSWATGLDYVTTAYTAQPPTTAIAADATWALPAMSAIHVAIGGSATPATISAVAMTWNTFEGILHNANNVLPMGTISNPSNAANVVIVQGDNTTIVLRLPPKLRIQQSEQQLLQPGSQYAIPDFYGDIYRDPANTANPAKQKLPTDKSGIMQLHANRVGDYSMGLCQ